MTRRISLATALVGMAMTLLALALAATPALAHHRDGHDHGGGNAAASDHDGDAGTEDRAYTEADDGDADDDTDPNVDGDDNAHPSARDRSAESGGSGNQGRSESNPDDSKGPMRDEGEPGDDKPAGPGGTDLADQDGNNGCGNDDDFDDDNNGHCGKPEEKPTTPPDEPEVGADISVDGDLEGAADDDEPFVLGTRVDRARVLGQRSVQAAPATAEGSVLPFTGGNVLGFVALGLGLIVSGGMAAAARRK